MYIGTGMTRKLKHAARYAETPPRHVALSSN